MPRQARKKAKVEGKEDISVTMKRIAVSYAWYYNMKYKTTGHLFQDRFISESVETDGYLLTVKSRDCKKSVRLEAE